METTWTSAHIIGWNALTVQIGNSRAYLWRKNVLTQITRDQTLAQDLIDTGISVESANAVRHILTNSLGAKNNVKVPDVGHFVLKDGDRLLLCTDGLTDTTSDNDLADVLSRSLSPQATCDTLVQLALERGGEDNVTVILAEFIKELPVGPA
jgi:protein phosphatase